MLLTASSLCLEIFFANFVNYMAAHCINKLTLILGAMLCFSVFGKKLKKESVNNFSYEKYLTQCGRLKPIEHSLLAVHVNPNNWGMECSEELTANQLFGENSNSLKELVELSTYGRVKLSGEVTTVDLNFPMYPGKCHLKGDEIKSAKEKASNAGELENWRKYLTERNRDIWELSKIKNTVLEKLENEGVELADYSKVMFMLPRYCRGPAVAGSRYAWANCSRVELMAHEFSHNLGLGHSASVGKGGDPLDSQGGVASTYNPVNRCIMGVLDREKILEIRESGVYQLKHLNHKASEGAVAAAIVREGVSRPVFLSWRNGGDAIDQALKWPYFYTLSAHAGLWDGRVKRSAHLGVAVPGKVKLFQGDGWAVEVSKITTVGKDTLSFAVRFKEGPYKDQIEAKSAGLETPSFCEY